MTKIIETDVQDWKKSGNSIQVADDYKLDTVGQTDLCKFYGLPGVLPKVDAKHNTSVVKEVMSVCTSEKVKFLVDDEKHLVISPLDPRSEFISDEQWGKMRDEFTAIGLTFSETPKYHTKGWGDAWFEVPIEGDVSVFGDAIRKTIQVQRMPQGGCHLSLGILRQICTNGAVVPEKEYSHLSRHNPFNADQINAYVKGITDLDLEALLSSKWSKDGRLIEASVGDYYGMRSTLLKATDEDTAKLSFPTEPITEFYQSQGIELGKINNSLRNRIPAGMTYYDCFNILTHGMKQVKDRTLEQEIEIAGWGFGARPRQLAQTADLVFKGRPTFTTEQIRVLKGDRRVA